MRDKRTTFTWIEEYSQFLQPCNWYTFTPFQLEIENDCVLGLWEVTFIIFGLGFFFVWRSRDTAAHRSIVAQVIEIKEHMAKQNADTTKD